MGAWLQILLQVLIIATGNYNFFNLLTMTLCLPCMIVDENVASRARRKLLQATVYIFLGYWCSQMFELYQDYHPLDTDRQVFGLKLILSKDACNELIEKIVPISVVVVLVASLHNAARMIMKKPPIFSCMGIFTKGLVCSVCILATAVPLYNLAPSMRQPEFYQRVLQSLPHENVIRSSGYGLFRRMTGVGRVTMTTDNGQKYGWAGTPPSIVARPEIIVEAIIEGDDKRSDGMWHELQFRWKPGNVSHWPKQVAPHQPRFDWRMWFAALGSYNHNPWFISFLDKVLNGCPIVLDLLDEPTLQSGKSRVVKVRANLYEYDFSRHDTEWARGIPGASILHDHSFWDFPEQVWTRKFVQQYLPELEVNNPSVQNYLSQTGLVGRKCQDLDDRCANVPTKKSKLFCQLAVVLRRWNAPCLLSMVALVLCLICKTLKASSRVKVKID